jgi:hypothetical protein
MSQVAAGAIGLGTPLLIQLESGFVELGLGIVELLLEAFRFLDGKLVLYINNFLITSEVCDELAEAFDCLI